MLNIRLTLFAAELSSDTNFLSFARSPCNFCKQNYLQYDHEQFLLKAYESIFLEGNVPKK